MKTCRIIKPKAAINPEVTVHAWSTTPLEGTLTAIEFWVPSLTISLTFFEGELSATKLLLSFNELLSLLNFFTGFLLAKALVLNFKLCKKKVVFVINEEHKNFKNFIEKPHTCKVKPCACYRGQWTCHLIKKNQILELKMDCFSKWKYGDFKEIKKVRETNSWK